ncbi:glycosyltransferase [Pseudoalteromonas simplex]|uniref:glycosyltransferase n=1 Tax=Pseudoalteromonas simplex TaxID=2783613 RepID=UPI0018894DDF|nr:glycosyltransferase [Pseudoalteromonas sp. A520]
MSAINKVLFIAPRFHTNQIGIVKALLNEGVEVEFHVLIKGPTEDYAVLTPIKIEEGKFSRFLSKFLKTQKVNKYYAFPSFFEYFNTIKNFNADLIIIRDPGRFFSIVSTIIAKLLGIKICFYTQETLEIEAKNTFRYFFQKFYKTIFHAEWITPIGGTDTRIKKFLPFVVESRFDYLNETSAIEGYSSEKAVAVIGKFTARKRLIWALKLAQEFDCKIKIIGENTTKEHATVYQELLEYVEEHNLGDNVEFMCNLSHSRTLKELSCSNFFLLTARNEPASISVLESLSVGIPVICPLECGTSSYLTPEKTGYTYRQDDYDDLKNKFRRLLVHVSEDKKIRVECLNSSAENFSEQAYINKFNYIFKRE